jgi:hypothetical protein
LLQAVSEIAPIVKVSEQLELACLSHSLKFNKEDFVEGHLDFIIRTFDVSVKRIIDNVYYFRQIKERISHSRIELQHRKVNLRTLKCLIQQGNRIIVNIDLYHLFRIYHYPHWIYILNWRNADVFEAYDPWDGQRKVIPHLPAAINQLRSRLKLSPQIIIVQSRQHPKCYTEKL